MNGRFIVAILFIWDAVVLQDHSWLQHSVGFDSMIVDWQRFVAMTNMRIAAEIEERQRMNALRMKESQRMSSLSKSQLLQPKQVHSTVARPAASKSTTDQKTKW